MAVEAESNNDSPWTFEEQADGAVSFRLSSWSRFFDFLEAEVLRSSTGSKQSYIWRGQRNANWSLSSSLDRLLEKLGLLTRSPDEVKKVSDDLLTWFRYASRGRRGLNPAALSEDDWWALGQHFGLATPLLDWTRSPFAAAYFAFEESAADQTEHRVVYGLDQNAVKKRNEQLIQGPSEDFERGQLLPIIRFVDPMSDENQRLVSQGGLFTRAPIGMPIERWVAQAFEGSTSPVLLRIEIPNSDRLKCLRALNRMNINHLSLFPDLSGASRSTNLKLELESEGQGEI